MSEEQKEEKKQMFNIKANTVITALFGILISGIGFVNHLQMKSTHDDTMGAVKELKIELVGSYVSKSDFSQSVAALSSTDSKLWEKEANLGEQLNKVVGDINLKLQHIEDSQPNRK